MRPELIQVLIGAGLLALVAIGLYLSGTTFQRLPWSRAGVASFVPRYRRNRRLACAL
jgi:hypothetical protein